MTQLMIVIHSLKGGGSERVLLNLLKGLDRKEFSITLVLYEGILDYPLPPHVDLRIMDIPAGRNIFTLACGFVSKIMGLAALIRKTAPDVIFSLLSSTNVAVILARLYSGRRCTTIVSEHTYPSVNLNNERYGWITGIFMKAVYPKADKIIAVSQGIREDLVRNFGIRQEIVLTILNPVDIEEIERLSIEEVEHDWFREGIPVILAVGRLTKQKGYPYLIQAFSTAREFIDCRLMIVGEGEDREGLVRLSKEKGLQDSMEFLGFQTNPFKYMARSSVFVMSSLYEGFPNVLLEAMALGMPVVSSDCPSGPAEIIEDKKSGILVPLQDADALAKAIVKVLTDDGLKKTLAAAAKVRARSFSLDRTAEKYRGVFLEDPTSPL